MKHRNKLKIFDRKKEAREALFKSLATNLVIYEKIKTTEAKAKALRPYVEKMITLGKKNNLHSRRMLLNQLMIEGATRKVLEVLSPRFKERKGGYLRIVKTGPRKGDGANMAIIEFVKDNTEKEEKEVNSEKNVKDKKAKAKK